jgi:hypothetical protein
MENNCEVTPKPRNLKELVKSRRFLKPFLALLLGGLAGFAYYYFVGCNSGTCAITSSPYMSTFWGAMMGFFLVSSPCSSGKC